MTEKEAETRTRNTEAGVKAIESAMSELATAIKMFANADERAPELAAAAAEAKRKLEDVIKAGVK